MFQAHINSEIQKLNTPRNIEKYGRKKTQNRKKKKKDFKVI